ncbi:MFS transporter, partial [Rhizobium ruizarguesonis]
STLSSMLQQVSMLLGVALAAAMLTIASALRGADNPVLADFRWAFIVVGVIGVASSLRVLQLQEEAGAEVSGHRKFQKS